MVTTTPSATLQNPMGLHQLCNRTPPREAVNVEWHTRSLRLAVLNRAPHLAAVAARQILWPPKGGTPTGWIRQPSLFY